MRDGVFPLFVIGGGALGLLALRPTRAEAGRRTEASKRERPFFDLGRPTPADIRTIVSSGWSRPRGDRLHRALDLPMPVGTPIHAIDRGVAVRVQREDAGDAGRWVGIRHPSGMTSRYIHLSKTGVSLDDQVERGQLIGYSGNTGNSAGPHLHLDLRVPAELLAAVELEVGKPRTGWGPSMAPYGFSIPGEPWVPVDGYRASVEREARAAGIPLHGGTALRNAAFTYRPVGERGLPYPAWVRELRGRSGVYVIRDRHSHEILYVGESSAGRLYETLTRHFQAVRHEAQEVPMT